MKCDELLKLIKNAGWYEIRQKGSHKIMKHDKSPKSWCSLIIEVKISLQELVIEL